MSHLYRIAIPSLKSIRELTDHYRISPHGALQIRHAMESARGHDSVDRALKVADQVLGGHGIEAIESYDAHVDNYYYSIVALYVNMGDTYNGTILFDTDREKFYVTTWGDWVERQERSRRYKFQ